MKSSFRLRPERLSLSFFFIIFKRKFSDTNIIKRRKFLIVRTNEKDIVIRSYINYSESKTLK